MKHIFNILKSVKHEIEFIYDLAKNPFKFDFEFTFDETDMP